MFQLIRRRIRCLSLELIVYIIRRENAKYIPAVVHESQVPDETNVQRWIYAIGTALLLDRWVY